MKNKCIIQDKDEEKHKTLTIYKERKYGMTEKSNKSDEQKAKEQAEHRKAWEEFRKLWGKSPNKHVKQNPFEQKAVNLNDLIEKGRDEGGIIGHLADALDHMQQIKILMDVQIWLDGLIQMKRLDKKTAQKMLDILGENITGRESDIVTNAKISALIGEDWDEFRNRINEENNQSDLEFAKWLHDEKKINRGQLVKMTRYIKERSKGVIQDPNTLSNIVGQDWKVFCMGAKASSMLKDGYKILPEDDIDTAWEKYTKQQKAAVEQQKGGVK